MSCPKLEQSFVMAIFTIFESTQQQGWEFHFNKIFCKLSFLKISKKKITKIVVSPILKKFGHSQSDFSGIFF